jgi:hypothetical protein
VGAHGRQSALVTVPGPRGALIRARENTDGALDPFSEGAQITPHKRASVLRLASRPDRVDYSREVLLYRPILQ